MFSHMTVGSNDLAKSKVFYDALFAVLGAKPGISDPNGRLFYSQAGASFMVTQPIDGNPACVANGSTIGFTMDSPEQVQAWHDAGVAAGGTSIEDPPGLREMPGMKLFLAYLRDPDGHKLCALHLPV